MSVDEVEQLAEEESSERRATSDLDRSIADAIVADGGEE